jgi:hypothetical protein
MVATPPETPIKRQYRIVNGDTVECEWIRSERCWMAAAKPPRPIKDIIEDLLTGLHSGEIDLSIYQESLLRQARSLPAVPSSTATQIRAMHAVAYGK